MDEVEVEEYHLQLVERNGIKRKRGFKGGFFLGRWSSYCTKGEVVVMNRIFEICRLEA